MSLSFRILFFICCLFGTIYGGPISGFSAFANNLDVRLDKSKIRLGEVATLLIKVRGEGSQFEVENLNYDLEGLNAITRSQGSQLSSLYENGRFLVKRSFDFRIVLEATKEGKASIRNIKIETSQGVLQHNDLFVEVLPPDPSNNSFQGLTQNTPSSQQGPSPTQSRLQGGAFFAPEGSPSVFVAVETNKTEAVINEEIFVTYWAYRRVNIRDFIVSKWPNLPGFWKQQLDLRTSFNWEPIQYEGELYYRTPVAEYAVFPVREGVAEIDRLEIEGKMLTGGSGGLNVPGFPSFGGRTLPFKKDNRPIEIKVKALPSEGRPESFSNLVGSFEAKLRSSTQSLKVGETFKLFLEIKGRGNLRLLEEAPFEFPEGWDFFNSKRRTRYRPVQASESEFELVAIPKKAGEYKLGPIEISYYNPESKSYEVTRTQSLKVEVAPGQLGSTPADKANETQQTPVLTDNSGQGGEQARAEDSEQNLKPLSSLLESFRAQNIRSLLWLVWFLVVVFTLSLFYRVFLNRFQKTKAFREQEKTRLFKAKLKKLRKAVEKGSLKDADQMFREILADHLNQNPQDLTLESMRFHGLKEEAKLIEGLQRSLYSGQKSAVSVEKKQLMRQILELASSKTPQKS